MPRSLLGIAGLALIVAANGSAAAPVERRFDFSNFHGVAIEGSMNAVVTQGSGFSVVAKGEKEALDLLDPVVENGLLKLKPKQRLIIGYVRSHGPVTVFITLPAIDRFLISGSGDGKLSNIKAKGLELSIAGAGDISAQGSCDSLNARIAGSGDISAAGLRCSRVAARIAGSGDISAYASAAATAKIAGAGDIRIHGNPPSREVSTVGSGDITFVPPSP